MDDKLKGFLKQIKENESIVSMFFGGLVVVVVAVLLFNYYKTSKELTSVNDESAATISTGIIDTNDNEAARSANENIIPQGLPIKHTVEKGEYLWSIAQKYYNSGFNWVDIAKENNIKDGDKIAVGQEITIPQVRVRVPLNKSLVSNQGTTIKTQQAFSGSVYKVQKGDSLWTIAVKSYADGYKWPEILASNKNLIKEASVIEIGWELQIPR